MVFILHLIARTIKIKKIYLTKCGKKTIIFLQKTTAHRRYKDDVESHVKMERLRRMTTLYRKEVEKLNKAQIGQFQLVLVEGVSISSIRLCT